MMSNATSAMAEPSAAAGQAHAGQRNVQFRMSASQQQQQLQQHHHHSQQQHDMSGHGSANSQSSEPSFSQQRSNGAPSASQSQSTQYTHFGSTQQPQQHSQHLQHQQQQNQQHQQHQQRPPIPPAHQPRLHHSISAGNIAMVASASRFAPVHGGAGGAGPNTTLATTQPKKKDPYATAWRTYSKIAEELQLLNPDGTLYPISKEAILKYLHHQSKRIKSSNLHWYVNGLKKHQENLGFPWDDVRYDEQVVSLLKELTLHPVMAAENGDDDGHGGHTYGSGPQAGRQRQSSAGTSYSLGKSGGAGGHHYSSSSIDTTRIANLSISQQPPPPPTHHSQQQQHQQHQQRTHGSSYGAGAGLKQQHQNHQLYLQQHQQLYQQSQRIQQPPPPKPYYHSAPIQVPPSQHSRTPSAQDFPYQSGPSHYHSQVHGGANQSGEAIGQRPDPPGTFNNALAKRKRNELEFRKRRVTSSMGLEGEDKEDDDLRDERLRNDDDDLDGRDGHDVDDLDYMEDDPNRYQPLKRRASTGTLLNQARASAVKHIPGPFATDPQRSGTNAAHPKFAYGEGLSSNLGRHNDDHQNLRSPSPDLREDDLTGRYSRDSRREGHLRARDSPPDSISSASSAGASQLGQILEAEARRHRHLSGGGGGCGALDRSSSTASASSPTGAAVGTTVSGGGAGKTTVHFSEVVECAQQLQTKYGDRCKDHPWGCVEIPGEQHLELTIKMYLDWAGLVASHRLTMDDLPDLPEFRRIQPVVVGGTLRRMASTPLTSSLFNASAGSSIVGAERSALLNSGSSTLSMTRRHPATADDDSTLTGPGSSRAALFGAYRSPSSSPPIHHHHHQHHQHHQQEQALLDESEEKPTLTSRVGSSPPPPLIDSAAASQQPHRTSPAPGLLHRGARKMPSTPILRQQQQYPSSGSGSGSGSDRVLLTRHLDRHTSGAGAPLPSSHHRGHPHRGSIISNSTASSPASEVEDMSDEDGLLERAGKNRARRPHHTDDEDDEDEDEEEEEEEEEEDEDEDIDVSHYALSPWAAVKITTTTVRSGIMGAPGLAKPPLRDQIQESRGVTPTMKAGPMGEADGQAGHDKAMMRDGSAMAVDSECVVSEIGEIAEISEGGAAAKDGRGIANITHCGVDATAQVLDSMIIGRSDAGTLGHSQKTQEGVVGTHVVAAVVTTTAAVAEKEEEEEEEEEEADGPELDRGLDQCQEHMYDGRAMDVEDSTMIES